MKDAYTKLMVQQHTSEDAAFFEKLENAKSDKKRKYALNALVASACIILLIPITVLAAGFFSHPVKTAEIHYSREYDKTNIEDRLYQSADNINMVGYEIFYDNLKKLPIKDFPKEARKSNDLSVSYESWDEAVADLDIGCLNNSIFSDEGTENVFLSRESSHCLLEYTGIDNQPFCACLKADYVRDHIAFSVSATVAIDHPSKDEDYYENLHSYSISMAYRHRPKYEYETYVTTNGIPVDIVKYYTNSGGGEKWANYSASFAVNNISYHIFLKRYDSGYNPSADPDKTSYSQRAKAVLLEVLDGFTFE